MCKINNSRPVDEYTYNIEPFNMHQNIGRPTFGAITVGEGKIILLPAPREYTMKEISQLVNILNEFSKNEPTFVVNEPEWLEETKSKTEKDIDQQIKTIQDSYETQRNNLHTKKYTYSKLNKLLYTNDTDLEKAVTHAFELLGCTVKKTDIGANVDRYMDYKGKFSCYVEITGTKSKIDKKSNKITQIIGEHQQHDDNKKPILVANTYMDKNIRERQNINFTEEALILLKPCGTCCITSKTLFDLVLKHTEDGVSTDDIMKLIHETVGELDITKLK